MKNIVYLSNASILNLLTSIVVYLIFCVFIFFVLKGSFESKDKKRSILIFLSIVFWSIVTVVSLLDIYGNYVTLNAIKSKTYISIKGKVNRLQTSSQSGNKKEKFYIEQVFFGLDGDSKSANTLFLSQHAIWGGPIRKNGIHVKADYIHFLGTNKIIRLWIED